MRRNTVFVLFFLITFNVFTKADIQQKSGDLTPEKQKEVIGKIADLLKERYVFEDVAVACAKHLNRQFEAGVFKTNADVPSFAQALTRELQSISHDKHMRVRPAPPRREGGSSPLLDSYLMRQSMAARNFGLARAEVLEGNIGVLDIRFFPTVNMARPTAAAAMKLLENVDALIIDLRNNTGGNPGMIQYYCSHFFDKKTHLNSLYWREGNRTQEFWTLDSLDGARRSDVPIFLLTSNRTFSGGEEFSYNLKTRKRATLIGETTGGGANPGGFFPVDDQIGIFIPTGRAINPVTGTNWEGTGVEPDVRLNASEAFDEALRRAKEAAAAFARKNREAAETFLQGLQKNLESAESSKAFDEIEEILDQAVASGFLDEGSVNVLGYDYLGKDKTELAIVVFRFNVAKHPESSNTYDSLGEALMKAGRNAESIQNYQKSLELNPQNENARTMIRKMEGQQ